MGAAPTSLAEARRPLTSFAIDPHLIALAALAVIVLALYSRSLVAVEIAAAFVAGWSTAWSP